MCIRNEAEYMPISDSYSPVLHRIDQAVRWRAVHPNEPIPPVYDILTKYSKPPEQLVAKAKRQLEKLVVTADVKKGESNCVQKSTKKSLLTCSSSTENPIPETQPR